MAIPLLSVRLVSNKFLTNKMRSLFYLGLEDKSCAHGADVGRVVALVLLGIEDNQ